MNKKLIALLISSTFLAPAMAVANDWDMPQFDPEASNPIVKPDATPDRNPPTWGGAPLPGKDNGIPGVPERPVGDATPDRNPPTWGGTPVPDKDNGIPGVPDRPVGDATPDRPSPTPDRPSPDFGETPDWGPDSTPEYGVGALPQAGSNEVEIANLRADFENFAKETGDRFDQLGAGFQATVNARPMVTNGQSGVGVGFGYAGSTEAIAVGVAHHFKDTGWSISGTVNHATSTSNVSSDTQAGAGVQFAW